MDFSYLSGLPEDEFEFERSKLISQHIRSLPENKRSVAYLQQLRIDKQRIKLAPDEFMAWLGREMQENLANLGDQLGALKQLVDSTGPPPIKPASER